MTTNGGGEMPDPEMHELPAAEYSRTIRIEIGNALSGTILMLALLGVLLHFVG